MNQISDPHDLNCPDTKPLLDDFLSDQLGIETTRKILAHLQECRDCSKERERREQIRAVLKRCWNAQSAPRGLRHSVLESTSGSPRRRGNSTYLRLAAGILLLFVGVSVYLALSENSRFSSFYAKSQAVNHFQEVAADHLRCNGHPAAPGDLPLGEDPDPFQRVLASIGSGYAAVGVMECRVGEASFTHYLYRGSEGLFSVMVESREPTEHLPRRGDAVTMDGITVRTVHQGPLVLAGFEAPRHFVYLVGDHFTSEETVRMTRKLLPYLESSALWRAG